MKSGLLAAAAFLGALSSNARADANSLLDYLGPREIAIGEAMRAGASGHAATTLNPAGLALGNNLVFEGSYGFRPGDSASAVSVSACDATVAVPGCFYYNYFAAQPSLSGEQMNRRVHQFGIALARRITPQLLIGVNNKYFDYESDVSGEGDASGFATDAGLLFSASSSVQAAVVGYNLLAKDSPQYPMGVGAGLALHPVPALSLGFDGLWDLDEESDRATGRYSGGAEYFLSSQSGQSGYPLRFGTVYDHALQSTYLTAGLGFVNSKFGIDVGARKQVDGGDELMIQAGLRLFGPSVSRRGK